MQISRIKAKHIAIGLAVLVLLAEVMLGFSFATANKIYEESIHLEEDGKIAQAKAGYKKAIRLNPWHADAHYQLGNLLRNEGKISEALRQMKQAEVLNKDEFDYKIGLGFLYLNYIGDNDKAEHYFSSAYSLDKNNFYACYMMGKLAEDDRNIDRAIQYYKQAIKAEPNLTGAYKQTATLYEVKGSNSEAKFYWEQVLKLDPGDEDAISYLQPRR